MSTTTRVSPGKINARKEGRKFVLYIYDSIAGERLYRSGAWPFHQEGWNTYSKLKDAEYAAERLQNYLDEREGAKKPKSK